MVRMMRAAGNNRRIKGSRPCSAGSVHQSPAWKQARPFPRTVPVVSADVVEGFLRQLAELGGINRYLYS